MKHLRRFFEYLDLKGILNNRTKFCKHSEVSCYVSAFKGFTTNFYYAFLAKLVIALLLGLLKPRKALAKNLIDLASRDAIGFCVFLGAFAGSYKAILCTLRRILKSDSGVAPFLAGLISGLAYTLETSQKRQRLLRMALFIRAIDTTVNLLDKWRYIKKIKNFECYMFGPVISFLVYIYFYEKNLFPPGIDKAFMATANPTPEELAIAEEVYLKQGNMWYPGKAKKFSI